MLKSNWKIHNGFKKGGKTYPIKGKKEKDFCLLFLTTINLATGLIEICVMTEARADQVTD